jgi:hypothetical protein
MITLYVEENNPITPGFYNSVLNNLQFHQLKCPCGQSGCLSVHGYYNRYVKTEDGKVLFRICRVKCDQCGRMMVIKYGPHGKFLACPGFPECRNTKPYLEKIGIACPVCGKDIVVRKTKKGRRFYGCESGTECSFMS